MRRFISKTLILFALMLVVVGCQASEEVKNGQPQNAMFPVSITDATGNEITINKKPERIISLIPSNTEIAYSLGLGESVIAVTENDTYPEDVKHKEIIGGFQLNFEKIISLKPDLVLAHGLNGDVSQLQNAGINVVIVNNFESSFEDVYNSITLIAEATGTKDIGKDLIRDMKERLAAISEKAAKINETKTVWIEIDATLYTTGQGTFLNEMLSLINAENIARNEQGWPQFSEEEIINSNPDVIIATYEGAIATIESREAWEGLSAVSNKKTYEVNADLYSRAGPRLIEGVEQLATLIYPEVYKK